MEDDFQGKAATSKPSPVRRLTPIECDPNLLPWQRAEQLTRCFLYWMPVRSFPLPLGQREWLNRFLDRLSDRMKNQFALRAEVFLQFKVIYPSLVDTFLESSKDLTPFIGLGQRPGDPPPAITTVEDLQPVIEGRKKFDFADYVADYCYWLLGKEERRKRELFFGHGGMTIIFLKPDPATSPPKLPIPPVWRQKLEVFKKFDIESILDRACSLNDGFLAKSKQLFSGDMADNIQVRSVPFILPLLRAEDFFNRPEEECHKWFELFDLYINESPADQGIIMASAIDIEGGLVKLLDEMRQEGLLYPEAD